MILNVSTAPESTEAAFPQGDPALLAVDRAVEELRRGRLVAILPEAEALAGWRVVLALETAQPAPVRWLLARGARLVVTGERAAALGVQDGALGEAVALVLPPGIGAAQVLELGHGGEVADWRRLLGVPVAVEAADGLCATALRLAKHAQLMPALLVGPVQQDALPADVLAVDVGQAQRHARPRDEDLLRVSEARVPLRGGIDSHLVLYRDRRDATEHLAVRVGDPDLSQPVLARVHSSCFTGDLLGSLRCDCGEQLHTAVARLAAAGGGVLLYLAQEGRGIGLANKLRAYRLQDDGLDTLDANRHLGFSADERDYGIAAAMLRDLGITRIRLLSNSPQKLDALRAHGIDVASIEPLPGTPNVHNARYLRTKRERAGHL